MELAGWQVWNPRAGQQGDQARADSPEPRCFLFGPPADGLRTRQHAMEGHLSSTSAGGRGVPRLQGTSSSPCPSCARQPGAMPGQAHTEWKRSFLSGLGPRGSVPVRHLRVLLDSAAQTLLSECWAVQG